MACANFFILIVDNIVYIGIVNNSNITWYLLIFERSTITINKLEMGGVPV